MNKSDLNTSDAASDFQGEKRLHDEDCAKQHYITYAQYPK